MARPFVWLSPPFCLVRPPAIFFHQHRKHLPFLGFSLNGETLFDFQCTMWFFPDLKTPAAVSILYNFFSLLRSPLEGSSFDIPHEKGSSIRILWRLTAVP